MLYSDFRYSQVYSNKTPNTGVFLPKTGISYTETVPYSFSKAFQAFQLGSRRNQTSSIRWYIRIFDIPKCIPIKLQILGFFYRKQWFPLLKPSYIRSERCSKRPNPVSGVIRRALPDSIFGFSISQVYSNKTPNTGVFLPKTRISFAETGPYSFSKVFQAFQPGPSRNQTSSIRWHVRISDIPKCVSVKLQILVFSYQK